MTHIKPCLYCGGKSSLTAITICNDDGEIDGHHVECHDCHAAGPIHEIEANAIEEWNEPPRYCDRCETWATDYRPMLDPWGNVHDWQCADCEDNHDPEPLTDEDAAPSERQRRKLREAGR